MPNNPEIDVDQLMQRVRRDAEQIRSSGAIEQRRAQPAAGIEVDDVALTRTLDRHRSVTAALNRAEQENMPRASIPRRLALLGPLEPVLGFGLRVFNYAFKQQREFNSSILAAEREMVFMLASLGDAFVETRRLLATIPGRLAQLEEILAAQAPGGAAEERLDKIAARTEFSHERIDSAEKAVEAISARTEFCHERIDSAEKAVEAISARTEFSHERIDSAENTLKALSARLETIPPASQMRLELVDALRDVERRIAVGQEALLRNDALLRSELHALRRPAEPLATTAVGRVVPARPPSATHEALHAAIGDQFRGDRATIAKRFEVYLPYVTNAGTVDADHPVLDIGSGRGEWLSLLAERNFVSHGAELNELLVNEARTSGVDVRYEDGLVRLRACADGSLGVVSAFHVVEHLNFDDLCTLLGEAQRALAPGGLLLLETPDPRNILVSTRTFYLDPTHRNPVPAELLEFLVTSFGYAEITQLELHAPEAKMFADEDAIGAKLNSFFSRAQDYAIIARVPRA